MKIEIWSDYVCPFCYIGKRRLEEAIRDTGLASHVQVEMKAFQLDPTTPEQATGSVTEGLATKYGISIQEAENMMKNVEEQAKTVGLAFNSEAMKVANTFKAHRLAKLAEDEGVGSQVSERLLHAYFVEGAAIGQEDVLVQLVEEAGLSREKARALLQSEKYTEEVQRDIAEAAQLGVRGVPFFVIDRKYAISGAQSPEAFAEALRKVAEEQGIQPTLQVLGDEADSCSDGQCDWQQK